VGNARIITRRWATVGITGTATVTDITVTGALDGGDGMRLHFGVLNTTVTITVTDITVTTTAPA